MTCESEKRVKNLTWKWRFGKLPRGVYSVLTLDGEIINMPLSNYEVEKTLIREVLSKAPTYNDYLKHWNVK